MIARVLSPVFLLAFRGLIILSKPKASRVRAVLCCCNMQGDALEFSHVPPTISDGILGMSEHFLTDKETEHIHVHYLQYSRLGRDRNLPNGKVLNSVFNYYRKG